MNDTVGDNQGNTVSYTIHSKPKETVQKIASTEPINGRLSALYFSLPILVLVGNLLMIIVILTTKRLQRPPHCFTASMALADLPMAFGPTPLAGLIVYHGRWPVGHLATCAFWVGSSVVLAGASMYNLASISVDRLTACAQPIQYRTKPSRIRTTLLIAGSWMIPTFLPSIPLANGSKPVIEVGSCHGGLEMHVRISIILSVLFVPSILIACTNLCILHVLCSRPHGIGHRKNTARVMPCDTAASGPPNHGP